MLPVCRGAGPSHALAMSMNSISPSGITFIFFTACHPLHSSSLQDSGKI
ncbi:lipoprotein [Klebsiella variicola]|uniref:Putative lipoprotein n=1 Tax=Klebsiella variicola (strain 342) TaxID=507522 RepID=B5XSF3_KLEV3|nr:putative lipoprotein [Klebsiella variicola]MDT7005203.1 lipoprotein [Klebsiella variicola]MDT7027838.1 lipoprotein [Klebsiella variicola]